MKSIIDWLFDNLWKERLLKAVGIIIIIIIISLKKGCQTNKDSSMHQINEANLKDSVEQNH